MAVYYLGVEFHRYFRSVCEVANQEHVVCRYLYIYIYIYMYIYINIDVYLLSFLRLGIWVSRLSRATDFGSGYVHTWGSRVWGSVYKVLGQPISDLETHMPVLKKNYNGPFNLILLFRET